MPTPRTVLLDGSGIVLFPTTKKLEWTEELPEAQEGELTISPFTPGRRNSEKGRRNSGPCCMLTGEAGETGHLRMHHTEHGRSPWCYD